MSSTNLTKNLKLSQFVASDKPSWLGDVNGDNKKIDDGYGVLAGEISKANDTASSAKSQSDANTQTLGNVNTELEEHENRITALEAGGGTEQLEQRVNTLGSDVEALQTRADTFDEDISQNSTDITSLKGRVDTIEPKVKTNSDNITSLKATTNELSETVQNVNSTALTLQTDMTSVKQRLSSTETTASNAFNKSQENAVNISTLTNEISNKTNIRVTALTLNIPSNLSNSIRGSAMMFVSFDGINCSFVFQITPSGMTINNTPANIGTVDLSGIIPDIANKTILFNQATFKTSDGHLIKLNGAKDNNNNLSLSLSRSSGPTTSSDMLFFIGTFIIVDK